MRHQRGCGNHGFRLTAAVLYLHGDLGVHEDLPNLVFGGLGVFLGEAEGQVVELHACAVALISLQTAKLEGLRPSCSVDVGIIHGDIVANDRPPLHVLKLKLEHGEGGARKEEVSMFSDVVRMGVCLNQPNVVSVEAVFGNGAVVGCFDRPESVAVQVLTTRAAGGIRRADGIAPLSVEEDYLCVPRIAGR